MGSGGGFKFRGLKFFSARCSAGGVISAKHSLRMSPWSRHDFRVAAVLTLTSFRAHVGGSFAYTTNLGLSFVVHQQIIWEIGAPETANQACQVLHV